MVDRVEKMRRKQPGSAVVPAPGQLRGGPGTTPLPPAAKKPPAGPDLKFSCGHSRPSTKVLARPCQACQDGANAAARKQARAVRLARQQARGAARGLRRGARLPDGSWFEVSYNAGAELWFGSLHVGDAVNQAVDVVFEGSASGVFRLLADLDAQYRKHLAGGGGA